MKHGMRSLVKDPIPSMGEDIRLRLEGRTGVSMATAPWRAKQAVILAKATSRMRIWSGSRSRAPFAILGFLLTCEFRV